MKLNEAIRSLEEINEGGYNGYMIGCGKEMDAFIKWLKELKSLRKIKTKVRI